MSQAIYDTVAPEELGIDPDKLEAVLARARHEVDEGLLPACQIAIARHGRLAAFEALGDASKDSLFNVFSATKAISAAAGWLLIQDGLLNVEEKVADIIPEFANNGKDGVTVEQLFTHTAGFPSAPFRPTEWFDHDKRMARFASWRLNWEPGSRYEYHPTSSMWVLAEIIERRSGVFFAVFLRERIIEPLGLHNMFVGCPDKEHPRIQPVTHVGEPMTEADWAELGLPVPPDTEVTPEALTAFNQKEMRRVPVPGGGGIMTAADLALFHQALGNGGQLGDGPQVWQPKTIAAALKVRHDLPDPAGVPAHRALGLVIAGDEKRNQRGFGHTNSEYAFGHNGAGGQIAWADPATGISLGYCTNGHDANPVRQARRGVGISSRAAICALD